MVRQNQRIIVFDAAILWLIAAFIANLFKSRRRLEAENLFLRHQLDVAVRRRPLRLPLRGSDRAVLGPSRCAGDNPPVASGGVPELLALDITKAGRAPADRW